MNCSIYPSVVIWNFGYQCNMSCLHCYTRNLNEKLGPEAFDYVDNFAQSNVMQVHFGGGESLLRKDFLPVVDKVYQLGMGVSLSTNGFLLNPEIAQGFRGKVNLVGLSLHGASAETHDRFTQCSHSFDRLIQAHHHLKKADINHKFIVVLCTKTAPEAVGIIRVAAKLGINVRFYTMKNVGNALKNKLELKQEEWQVTRDNIVREAKNHSIEVGFDDETLCACGRFSVTVRANGDISACALAVDVIGNLKDNLLVDVWQNHPKLVELREKNLCPCKD